MLVRGSARCFAIRRLDFCKTRLVRYAQRRCSTAPPTTSTSNNTHASILGTLTSELDKIAPRFEIDGSQVHIIESPTEFYLTLKSKIQNAERRIFLSTLYIGRTEHELIFLLQQALRRQPKLRLNILTDALRGTRESPESSCASLLAPLVAEFGSERVDIRLYHTPNLTGFRKHYIPQRINEGWGLQHMKLYGIDDDIIISGANLSHDYFTNRQDRYHLFSSSAITEYFWNIQHAVSTLSFVLSPDAQGEAGYVLTWPASNTAPSPLLDPTNYIKHATALLEPIIKAPPKVTSLKTNTSVYPLSQLTQLLMPNTSTELPAIKTILKTLSFAAMTDSAWTFTAGYFNPDPSLTQLLVNAKSLHGTVVTASPRANGFYGSTGVSGMLPSAYTLYSRRFLERIHEAGRGNAIILKEWQKGTTGEPGGWTYHAKGLWITMPKGMGPSLTLIGSSNYTKRSYSLDLEANALIVTQDEDLQRRLGKEQNMLQNSATVVGLDDLAKIDRRVSLRVRIAIWIVGILGGAL